MSEEPIYYEIHVHIEPVPLTRMEQEGFIIAEPFVQWLPAGWQWSMVQRGHEEGRIILTRRRKELDDAKKDIKLLVELAPSTVRIKRRKIEAVVLDERD